MVARVALFFHFSFLPFLSPAQLDELYEHGFLDEDEYDRRRQDILNSLSFDSTAGPEDVAGDGVDTCHECGDAFDEINPPFCANCGAKTRYFGKQSVAADEDESSDELPLPPPPPIDSDSDDEFGKDMLDELLDDLRVTDSSSSSSRQTFHNSGTERFSNRQVAAKPPVTSKPLVRDTFMVSGSERFSERQVERSREDKAKVKAKAKQAGARPAVGGDASWEALQAQMKKKQQEKQLQKETISRDTFASTGRERFSGRQAKPRPSEKKRAEEEQWSRLQSQMQSKKKGESGPKKQPQLQGGQMADDLDAELAALEAGFDEEVIRSEARKKQLDRDTFVGSSGHERFSKRSVQTRHVAADLDAELAALENDLDDDVEVVVKPKTKKKQASAVAPATMLARDTFAGHSGQERFSERQRGAVVAPMEPVDDLDAELAALEADLGDHLSPSAPKGRTVEMARPVGTAQPKKVVRRTGVKVEDAKGGPALPEGLKWKQTPAQSKELPRSTFAHQGTDRFSDRRDPALPKGLQETPPDQMCSFCQKGIGKGEKFKTALGVLWHAGCFKCGVCSKQLVKGMKFFKGDLPGSAVCEDCKGKRRNVCHLCKGLTAKKELVNVMGRKVHTKCFRCNICDTSLLGGYLEVKGQFVCIAHKDCDPVPRNWADPNDRGPGTAAARPVVKFGPSEEEKARIQKKKKDLEAQKQQQQQLQKRQQQQKNERQAQQHRMRQTTQSEHDVMVDLDLLNDLLDETGPIGGAPVVDDDEYWRQRESESEMSAIRESDILRYANTDGRVSEVRKPRRSSRRVEASPQYEDDDDDDDDDDDGVGSRMSSAGMLDEADKPDWMKAREQEQRGSFRSNARKAQQELDQKQGVDDGYYSMDSDDDDDDDEMMMRVTYQPKSRQ